MKFSNIHLNFLSQAGNSRATSILLRRMDSLKYAGLSFISRSVFLESFVHGENGVADRESFFRALGVFLLQKNEILFQWAPHVVLFSAFVLYHMVVRAAKKMPLYLMPGKLASASKCMLCEASTNTIRH
jgi:hypothetical protein